MKNKNLSFSIEENQNEINSTYIHIPKSKYI